MSEGEGGDSQLNAVVKDTTRIETEIEIGKQKLMDTEGRVEKFLSKYGMKEKKDEQ